MHETIQKLANAAGGSNGGADRSVVIRPRSKIRGPRPVRHSRTDVAIKAATTQWSIGRALLALASSTLLLGGCASSGNPMDAFEGVNRIVFALNNVLENILIKPAAPPGAVSNGVGHFSADGSDHSIGANEVLGGNAPSHRDDE